ncbi:MAG: ATP phosphoribosyltransferase regulatory subunit [Rhodospirillaceae bacterium]|jgi:ATP phosphoribosyltransferase regulatory subunit|nr:ATP phosphoribosyltransferase regulatory subunit [Rhodospirillaceae bacterium]MBT5895225.1 ATP phosphoribosyltransferase regulatory subunit [Rhodospirillaceae bacterium]MBT6429208.1 ATP phosphoribosyltransferase regulatory subunit [Rhodospirillaceae bacterium]
MTDYAELALLPEGLHDDLPPFAGHEARSIEQLVAQFESHGYERVKPPLIEFEESLLSGPGAGVARHMFRLMDPISQRMMGLRADMTTQVARIAATRLAEAPRPLRLCYSGQVLRVRGSQLRPERQYAQAGVELIGAEGVAGDAELVLLAAESLQALGVRGLSVDLTVPTLVPLLTQALGLDGEAAESARQALDGRDGAAIDALPPDVRQPLAKLMRAAGPAKDALKTIAGLDLPASARSLCDHLGALVEFLDGQNGGLTLTVDPGESRGFEYQTGVSFSLFADGIRGELGRGGRYSLEGGESAIGFTLYMDSLMRAIPEAQAPRRLYIPFGMEAAKARKLRVEGWITVQGLDQVTDPEAEARTLACDHILRGDKAAKL